MTHGAIFLNSNDEKKCGCDRKYCFCTPAKVYKSNTGVTEPVCPTVHG